MKKENNAFNWDIKQTGILDINGNLIKGYKQITRDDDGSSIAVMKNSYTPMTTQEFTETANEVASKIGGDIKEFRDWANNSENIGAAKPVITAQMKMSEPLSICGSKIEGVLTMGTGFDGYRSFFIGHVNTYLRCSNQFASIVKDFTSRLTKNNLIRVADIINNIEIYREYEQKLYEDFNRFQKVKIDETLIQECIARLVNMTDEERMMTTKEKEEHMSSQKLNKIDDIISSVRNECADLGNTAWGLFNSVTHYSTHIMNSRGSNEMSTMFGAKANFNKIGYNFCKELIEA